MFKDPSNISSFTWEGNGICLFSPVQLSGSVSHQATNFKNMISSNNKTKHDTTTTTKHKIVTSSTI
jgi:hypothetical protein